MPKLSAILHTHNDALRLGRALDSLRPCDEVLVIDDDSEDDTVRIAQEHGAKVKTSIAGVTPGAYVMDSSYPWVLILRPDEALADDLEASLFEWKEKDPNEGVACYKICIRVQNQDRWEQARPEVRLVNRNLVNWIGEMPPNQTCETTLQGDVLRFRDP